MGDWTIFGSDGGAIVTAGMSILVSSAGVKSVCLDAPMSVMAMLRTCSGPLGSDVSKAIAVLDFEVVA